MQKVYYLFVWEKGTKLADYIMNGKSYKAIVVLGITTTTEDASGEILQQKEVLFEQQKIKRKQYILF